MSEDRTSDHSTLRVHDLHMPIDEATEALAAIRTGEVDALVVSAPNEAPRVFLLKGADEAHRVLLETLNEGAMTVSRDATILYANTRLADLLERPLDRVLGASLTRYLGPADARAFLRMLDGHRGSAKAEMVLLSESGREVPVMVSMRAVGAEQEAYTVVVTDLTPLKQAQDALRVAKEELEERVLARTAELASANDTLRAEVAERTRLADELSRKAQELETADRRKDEFLSMLAHELRNPLSPILTSVEMLRAVSKGEPSVERYRSIIERQTRNLTRLVEDLLDVSRITRGVVVLRKQPVDLAALVAGAVEASRAQIEGSGHKLTVHLPPEPVTLQVDPTRFEQVLVNLLNNAAKYTEKGGHIAISAEVSGDDLTFRVRDDGIGISADLLPHVFELFVQGKRSLARSQGGLGIGLTLVKSLVAMHGGTVEARSDGAGCGTEMIVRVCLSGAERRSRPSGSDLAQVSSRRSGSSLPPAPVPSTGGPGVIVNDVSAAPIAHAAPSPGAPRVIVASGDGRGAPRVLVVEDNVDAAESLVELLEYWGFEVRSVVDGEAALRAAVEQRPHAALVDVGLPGMDGYEVARKLRQALPAQASSPVLIGLTGYGQERDRRLGAEAGFDHYLVKPLDADVLQSILERASLLPSRVKART